MYPMCPKKPISMQGILRIAMPLALVLFAGCSEPAKAPPTPVGVGQPVKKQAIASAPTATTETPKPAENTPPVYSYNPAGRRDPFAPIIEKELTKKAASSERPPLERYNISEFKLSGIIWGGFGYNAMLEGPDGKGYFVRVGTILGPNRGTVKKITQYSLVIEEKYKTYTGETERKEIIMELRKKQEAMP